MKKKHIYDEEKKHPTTCKVYREQVKCFPYTVMLYLFLEKQMNHRFGMDGGPCGYDKLPTPSACLRTRGYFITT